jgi:riboflavin kinase/FMN adenylyltransferase
MKTFTDISTLTDSRPAVLAIGNFDGVHLGHQALMRQAVTIAREKNMAAAVMTFEPHPREFFRPQDAPFRLTLLPMKEQLIRAQGIDLLYVPAFDAALASMSADEFMQMLKDKIKARHIVVGADFTFGKGKTGNVDSLRQQFDVTVVDAVRTPGGEICSSTLVRESLLKAEFEKAAEILGHEWQIEAEVVHGNKQGRELGFPTANQNVTRYLRIPFGIYAVEVQVGDESRWRPGVANFGIRPMFEVKEPLLETYIFDYALKIYGNQMRVKPLKYLRPEMRFDGLDALKDQMKQDCLAARGWLSCRS